MSSKKGQMLENYHAAKHDAVFYVEENNGYIRFSGEDRIGFIDKLTTNDVTQITPNTSITTILTSSIGRVLDVFQLFNEGGILGAATLPGHSKPSSQFLQGKIFFMDKVKVSDESKEIAQIDIEGPKSAKLLGKFIDKLPTELGQVELNTQILDFKATIVLQKGLSGDTAYRIFPPRKHLGDLIKQLIDQDTPQIDRNLREILRIEAGEAGADSEFSQDYNPLEVNCDWAVSTTKGCYPGQEVIARQINYDKITKKLVQLQLDKLASAGNTVRVDKKNIGEITSSAQSPEMGPIALAVLKRPYHKPGSNVLVETTQGEILGKVIT